MAGGQERKLRRRIRSAANIKKITRAMELISASRIVKAQQRVHASRPYADQITEVIRNLSAAGAGQGQPLLTPRDEVKTVALVAMAGDRGLAGAYNGSVIRTSEARKEQLEAEGKKVLQIAEGRKVVGYYRFRERELAAEYSQFSDKPTYENAREMAERLVGMYLDGEVDRVELIYTEFSTLAVQRVVRRPFIPLEPQAIPAAGLKGPESDDHGRAPAESDGGDAGGATYEYEPDPDQILERLLPRYAEAKLYAALLDAAASEHAARQRAMKSATDNAGELIKRLEVSMNRARQDAITTEIIEIASGAEALSTTSDSRLRDMFVNYDLLDPHDAEHTDQVASATAQPHL